MDLYSPSIEAYFFLPCVVVSSCAKLVQCLDVPNSLHLPQQGVVLEPFYVSLHLVSYVRNRPAEGIEGRQFNTSLNVVFTIDILQYLNL